MLAVRVGGPLPYYRRRTQNNSSARAEIRKIMLQDDAWTWEEEPKARTMKMDSPAAKMVATKVNELKMVKTAPLMFRGISVDVITAIEDEKTREQHVEEPLQVTLPGVDLAEAPPLVKEKGARVAES
ncbi:unnamed protein product [Amoebophrya sp. A25]|nr:unnamed protein product [Amoebophrya sp. A25]|eukprot:GSA25T00027646001.1